MIQYESYKSAGIDWLGEVPAHWKRKKFGLLARGRAFVSGPFGSSIGSQFYVEAGVPVIRGNNLSLGGDKPMFTDSGYVYLTEEKADELSNATVERGDLVFTARGTVGQVGLVPDDIHWPRAILSANQLRFRNRNRDVSSRYLWYLFEILSRVVYDALVQAASFLTPSSNTTPVMTSARSFAPFSALHRF